MDRCRGRHRIIGEQDIALHPDMPPIKNSRSGHHPQLLPYRDPLLIPGGHLYRHSQQIRVIHPGGMPQDLVKIRGDDPAVDRIREPLMPRLHPASPHHIAILCDKSPHPDPLIRPAITAKAGLTPGDLLHDPMLLHLLPHALFSLHISTILLARPLFHCYAAATFHIIFCYCPLSRQRPSRFLYHASGPLAFYTAPAAPHFLYHASGPPHFLLTSPPPSAIMTLSIRSCDLSGPTGSEAIISTTSTSTPHDTRKEYPYVCRPF